MPPTARPRASPPASPLVPELPQSALMESPPATEHRHAAPEQWRAPPPAAQGSRSSPVVHHVVHRPEGLPRARSPTQSVAPPQPIPDAQRSPAGHSAVGQGIAVRRHPASARWEQELARPRVRHRRPSPWVALPLVDATHAPTELSHVSHLSQLVPSHSQMGCPRPRDVGTGRLGQAKLAPKRTVANALADAACGGASSRSGSANATVDAAAGAAAECGPRGVFASADLAIERLKPRSARLRLSLSWSASLSLSATVSAKGPSLHVACACECENSYRLAGLTPVRFDVALGVQAQSQASSQRVRARTVRRMARPLPPDSPLWLRWQERSCRPPERSERPRPGFAEFVGRTR